MIAGESPKGEALDTRAMQPIHPRTGMHFFPTLPLACIFVLAMLLRFYDFNARSLWNDEGITILFTRLPWPDVLGLHGQYDQHPPLYYAVVKFIGLVVPELIAGRLLSVVAGSLTVLVLYELTRRLLNRAAGLVAAGVLCISPIHIWYSQEARQYALTVLTVAVSYLALVAFRQEPQSGWRWPIAYGASTAVAVYVDYSALFALAPQVVLLVMIAIEQRRHSVPVFGCLAVAVLTYLPWVPQAIISVQQEGTIRESFLGLNPDRFLAALSALMGLQDQGDYFQRDLATIWQMWEPLRVTMQVAAALAVFACAVLAWKGLRTATITICLLGIGTIATTSLASMISPSFAPRTILVAVLGWAMLVGMLVAGKGWRWGGDGVEMGWRWGGDGVEMEAVASATCFFSWAAGSPAGLDCFGGVIQCSKCRF